jgi:ribonuclease VapC
VNPEFVLDASALLSIVLEEHGPDHVAEILDRCKIHAVNLAEVIGRLVRSGMPVHIATATLAELHLEVTEVFSAEESASCGELLGTRRDLGLSLGDCVCLATATRLGAVAVTADRSWKELDGTVIGDGHIRVQLIR